jgi:NADH-quinone oxidoreductase subunit J
LMEELLRGLINVNMVAIIAMAVFALWTVMARSLIRSAIGLALTSAMLSVVMFNLNAPLAAVFELSVCSGLISVVFITAISLTKPMESARVVEYTKERFSRFWHLPLLLLAAGIALSFVDFKLIVKLPAVEALNDPANVMWVARQIDLFGQAAVLLAGGLGIALLFRERSPK